MKLSQMEDIDLGEKIYIERIEDEDPLLEETRVKRLAKAAVKVESLTKAYDPFHKAVDNLSFALDYGECFALLGITGAGKTTTFKCLC
jgi:ABC-type oligopeptide transport system ATPase subunit